MYKGEIYEKYKFFEKAIAEYKAGMMLIENHLDTNNDNFKSLKDALNTTQQKIIQPL